MRQTLAVFGIMVVLALLCAPAAHAAITCKVIPTMCPPEPGNEHDRDDGGGSHHPVPEPGTLALLMAGAGAAGAALRRRRNKS